MEALLASMRAEEDAAPMGCVGVGALWSAMALVDWGVKLIVAAYFVARLGEVTGPDCGLIRVLESQAEAVSDTFSAQGVAHILWAYAKMERKPGAGLMRLLEVQAEAVAGTFKAQNVSNTLWAYATMERKPGAGLMRLLQGRLEAMLPDRALCLLTFSHFLIVNKLLSPSTPL